MPYRDLNKKRENKKKYYQQNRDIILTRAKLWNAVNHTQYIENMKRRRIHKSKLTRST